MASVGARWTPAAPIAAQSGLSLVQIIPGRRAEELIASGRVMLGLCLLLAVVGGPDGPGPRRSFAITLLIVYSLAAAAVLMTLSLMKERILPYRAAIHTGDVIVMAALLGLTGGPTSGYFSTLFFPIVSGGLRWRQTGALVTGAALLLIFMTLSLGSYFQGELNVNTWLVRTAALIATVLILGQMRALEQRYAGQIEALANWPGFNMADMPDIASEVLPRAAGVFKSTKALMVIDEPEEPWLHVFTWQGGAFAHVRGHHSSADGHLVSQDLAARPLLLQRRGDASMSLHAAGGDATVPVPEWLATNLDGDTILSVPLRTENVNAHLFLTDPSEMTADDVPVAMVLARHVSDILEQSRLTAELKALTANEERIRLSRNLHDGVLQTLSGIALNLASARKQFETDPEKAKERLVAIEQLLLDEQRDLRFFTDELRLQSDGPSDVVAFADALQNLLRRLETIWSVKVDWEESEARQVPLELSSEVYQLVHEAIVNASRHGRASRVWLRFFANQHRLMLTITDNGTGFAFNGKLTLSQLTADKRGPRSLRERVEELAGDMSIESSTKGAELLILLPLTEAGKWA